MLWNLSCMNAVLFVIGCRCWCRCCTWHLNGTFQVKFTKFDIAKELKHWLQAAFCHRSKTKSTSTMRWTNEQMNEHTSMPSMPRPMLRVRFWHFHWNATHAHTFGSIIFTNNIGINLKWLLVVTVTADCWLLYQNIKYALNCVANYELRPLNEKEQWARASNVIAIPACAHAHTLNGKRNVPLS